MKEWVTTVRLFSIFYSHGTASKKFLPCFKFLVVFCKNARGKKTCWYRYVAIFRTLCLIPTKIVENKKRLKVTIMRMKNWIVLFLTWNCLREIQKIKSRNRYKRFCKRFKLFWKCKSAKDKVINAYKTVSLLCMNFSLTLSSVRFCFPVSWWKLKKGMNSSSQNFLIAADFEQPSSKNFVPVRRRLNNWTFCFKKVLQLFSRKITKSKFLKIRFWLFVAARSNFGLVKIGLFFVLFSFLKRLQPKLLLLFEAVCKPSRNDCSNFFVVAIYCKVLSKNSWVS